MEVVVDNCSYKICKAPVKPFTINKRTPSFFNRPDAFLSPNQQCQSSEGKRCPDRIASTCYFHLRWLRHLRHIVSQETRQRLVSALILSRIDYGNVIFAGLPGVTLAPLRRVVRVWRWWFIAMHCLRWPTCKLYFYVFTTVHDDQSSVVFSPSFL